MYQLQETEHEPRLSELIAMRKDENKVSAPEPSIVRGVWSEVLISTTSSAFGDSTIYRLSPMSRCHPEAQPKDLLQHCRTETSVARLFKQKSGPQARWPRSPTHSSILYTSQQVLRLCLRMTLEDGC